MSEKPRPLYTDDLAGQLGAAARATGERSWRPANGSEGEMFFERWCYRCTKDDTEAGIYCPIIAASMCFREGEDGYPSEWIIGDDGQPRCTAFVRDWSKS